MEIVKRQTPMPTTTNPFMVDHWSMGMPLSSELFLMTGSFPDQPITERSGAYLYNIKTGEAWDIVVKKEA